MSSALCLKSVSFFLRAGVTRPWSHIAPAHERAGMLERLLRHVTDASGGGPSAGLNPPRRSVATVHRVKTILREWGTAVDVPLTRVAARKHRRPNERERSASPTARAAATVVATLHNRREGIGPSADGAAEAEVWEEGSPSCSAMLVVKRAPNAGSPAGSSDNIRRAPSRQRHLAVFPAVSSDVTDSLSQTRVTFSAKPAPLDTPSSRPDAERRPGGKFADALCRNIATASYETSFRDVPSWHIPTRRVLV